MIRRLAPVVGALVCATSLSACSTFSNNNAAAVVEGSKISRDEYEAFLESGAGGQEALDAATGGEVLSHLVLARAIKEVLADNGIEITEEERQAFTGAIKENDPNDPFFTMPTALQEDLILRNAGLDALARVPVPATDVLAAEYAKGPARLGLACFEGLVVTSRSAAGGIVESVNSGTPIADVASDGTPISSGDGGVCVLLPNMAGTVDQAVLDELVSATPGRAVGPIETADGWAVIEVPPFEQVADNVNGAFSQTAGQLLTVGLLVTGDVSVDPAYGRWDPTTISIITT